jgi:hypothetical protein
VIERSDDTIPRLPVRDAFSHGVDDARGLEARCEGALRAELVSILDDEHVRIVDAAVTDGDPYLPGPRNRVGDISQNEGVGTAGGFAEQGFHGF